MHFNMCVSKYVSWIWEIVKKKLPKNYDKMWVLGFSDATDPYTKSVAIKSAAKGILSACF